MKKFLRNLFVIIYIPFAIVFWFFELIGLLTFSFEKEYKYFARGFSLILSIILITTAIRADKKFLPWNWGSISEKAEMVESCSPYVNKGCKIDLSNSGQHFISNGAVRSYRTIEVNDQSVSGSIDALKMVKEPTYLTFPSKYSPYRLASWEGKILLRGDISDFKYDRKLGWFNEDKFKVDKWIDGGCAYTFCIDKKGVEIYNVDYDVVFSFTSIGNYQYRFAGSYTNNDLFFVNNGELQQIFRNKKEALEYRRSIDKIFDFKNVDESENCKRVLYK